MQNRDIRDYARVKDVRLWKMIVRQMSGNS